MSRFPRRGQNAVRGLIHAAGAVVGVGVVGGGGGGGAPAGPTPGDGPQPDLVWIDASREVGKTDLDALATIADFSSRAVSSYPLSTSSNAALWKETAGVNSLPCFFPHASQSKYDLGKFGTDWGDPVELTAFGVMQDTATNFEPFFGTGSEAIGTRLSLLYRNTNHEFAFSTAAAHSSVFATDVGNRVPTIVSARYKSDSAQVWHQSGGPGAADPGGDLVNTGDEMVFLGRSDDGTQFWEANTISELLIYSTALSDAEMLQVETYLATKYAITLL